MGRRTWRNLLYYNLEIKLILDYKQESEIKTAAMNIYFNTIIFIGWYKQYKANYDPEAYGNMMLDLSNIKESYKELIDLLTDL